MELIMKKTLFALMLGLSAAAAPVAALAQSPPPTAARRVMCSR